MNQHPDDGDTDVFALIDTDGRLHFKKGVAGEEHRRAAADESGVEGFVVQHAHRGVRGIRAFVGGVSALRPAEGSRNDVALQTVLALGGRLGSSLFGPVALTGWEVLDDGDVDVAGLTVDQQSEIGSVYGMAMSAEKAERTGEHQHDVLAPPAGQRDDLDGKEVNLQLIGAFLSAAADGCTSCQDAHLTLLVEDPASVAAVVLMNCSLIRDKVGFLPESMTAERPRMIETHAPEFRTIARAAAAPNDPAGQARAIVAAAAAMTSTGRREAVNSAADGIVGIATMGF